MKKTLPFISLFVIVLFFNTCGYYDLSVPEYIQRYYPVSYNIGDRGPAGGWIFYIDKENRYPWTYLECAGEDLPQAAWGGIAFTAIGGTEQGLGTGKANTDIIVSYMEIQGSSGTAAQICREYSGGGFNDWFLPSSAEAILMRDNLYPAAGNFDFTDPYWSSSEYDDHHSYYIKSSGPPETGSNTKANTYNIRPIRSFKVFYEP